MTTKLMTTASAVALLFAMPAFAQTTPGTATQPRTQQNQPVTPPAGGTGSGTGTSSTAPQTTGGGANVQAPGEVNVQRLIGRNVTNAQNETVGDIESLIVDQSGQVRSAILGVGGFLGIGERHVAVAWDQLNVAPDRVTVNMTRDQVRALPEFRYAENQRRGTVFTDTTMPRGTGAVGTAPGTTGTTGTMSGASDTRSGTVGTTSGAQPPSAGTPPTGTGTMAMSTPGAAGSTAGEQALSASNLIGLNLRNAANEAIGEVKDIIVGADGKVSEVIVGVGGFLGMGERYVAISWDQLRMSRANDNRVEGQVGYTRDQLRDMPTWRQDRGGWIRG
jgi:sporulation protein YlmC with PRC-barrel domain